MTEPTMGQGTSDDRAEDRPAPDGAEEGRRADRGPGSVTGALEAVLLMATEPISTAELAQAVGVPAPVVWEALDALRTFYDETGRGFELREVGPGWRYYTRAEHHDVIASWLLEGQHGRLSQAALETLAVVAYLQPISRSRVGAIRGVNVDGVMRTLVTRDLIEESHRDEAGGAMLFRTTDHFLERMGLTALTDLPPIAPHLPEASLLEAELAGRLGAPSTEEDTVSDETDLIPENVADLPLTIDAETPGQPQGAPDAADASAWADEAVAEDEDPDRAAERQADALPAEAELDRLSEGS